MIKLYRDGKHIRDCQEKWGKEVSVPAKGGTRGFCDGTALNLDGGGGYMNTHTL